MFSWWRRKHIVVWLTFRGKIKVMVTGATVLLVLSLFVYQPTFLHSWKTAHPLNHQVIVLDAGHGGKDSGAVAADGTEEKLITLQITKKLAQFLTQAGATVYLTREDDEDLAGTGKIKNRKRADLNNRLRFIVNKHADMVLTLHLNAMPDERWRGAQTFYHINRNESNKLLASMIQDELVLELANTDRMAKPLPRPVFLLKHTKVPAALIECGFLSNREEANLLKRSKYQSRIAASIYRAVLRYSLEVGYNGKSKD